jgi:tetratricopeptide (TPR) repeat protein
LDHPNILTVHDYGETEDGQLYLVVTYVPGGTLRERLEQGMSLEEAVESVAQVAEALDYAHQHGVIHRDVKPNNILIAPDGRPLLCDFGLAKPIQSDRRLTATGVMLGTPDYVAPEQARAKAIDGRADIYALGVVLFEVLTGQHPFTGETPISIIIKHVNEEMPRPSTINADIPPALDKIVAKATAKAPEDRYQRAGEMARALRAALVPGKTPELGTERVAPGSTATATATPPDAFSPAASPLLTPWPLSRPWYQNPKVMIILAAILVAAVVAGLLVLRPKSHDEGLSAQVPTAAPGEAMILVSRFKAQPGSEQFDVSQRIFDRLVDDVSRMGETTVTVHQLLEVIESSEAAVELGREYGASTVIWGFYDDIGISPNIEAVDVPQDISFSVGLERFNVEVDEAVNFKLYIAKDLPEELSFLTSLSLVQTFLNRGRLDEAMRYMSVASQNLPENPQFRRGGETVLFLQGMMAIFEGDMMEAVAQIDRAIAINPQNALFHTMRGLANMQRGEIDQAIADTNRAIALDPDDLLAYTIKGAAAGLKGDMETVVDTYKQATELNPDDWVGHYILGWVTYTMGDLTTALAAFDRVREIMPQNPLAPVSRGLVYEKLGQSQWATADYAQAVEMGVPPNAAITMLSQVIRGEDLPSYAYLFECAAYQAQGDIEPALASCHKALEVEPGCFDALWKRGQLHVTLGDLEAAVSEYTSAIDVDPHWPWVFYLRAQALVELGRRDEALKDVNQALQLEPVDELRTAIEELRNELQ